MFFAAANNFRNIFFRRLSGFVIHDNIEPSQYIFPIPLSSLPHRSSFWLQRLPVSRGAGQLSQYPCPVFPLVLCCWVWSRRISHVAGNGCVCVRRYLIPYSSCSPSFFRSLLDGSSNRAAKQTSSPLRTQSQNGTEDTYQNRSRFLAWRKKEMKLIRVRWMSWGAVRWKQSSRPTSRSPWVSRCVN